MKPPAWLWLLLWLTFFWQTRFALCCQGQRIDYLIPFIYLADLWIGSLSVIWLTNSLTRRLHRLSSTQPSQQLRKFRAFWPPRQPKTNAVWLYGFLVGSIVFLLLATLTSWGLLSKPGTWYKLLKLTEVYLFAAIVAQLPSRSLKGIWQQLSFGLLPLALLAWGELLYQRSFGLQLLGEWQFSRATPGIAKIFLAGHRFIRPYTTFPHPNVLGGIFALVAIANLWEALHASQKKKPSFLGVTDKNLSLVLAIISSSIVFISFSRSAWLAYTLMLGLTFWLNRRQLGEKLSHRHKWLALTILVLLLPIILSRLLALAGSDQLSWERRTQLNQIALNIVRQKPLTGLGLNNFVPSLENYPTIAGQGRFLQPVHNFFLLIAAEVGLPALAVLLGSYALLIARLWQKHQGCLLTLWLGIFVTGMFDHYWWSLQHGLLMFGLTTGLSLGSIWPGWDD